MQAMKEAGLTQSLDDVMMIDPDEEIFFSYDTVLFTPDVHERYLELSRSKARACSCCGAEAEEGGKLQVCSKCYRKAYCSAACQRQDWKEGGHKGSCRPQKDFRKDDVVVAQGVESRPELNGQLMVVEGPDDEGRWLVLDARGKSISLHAAELRLVVPIEEREDVDKASIDKS